jgi:hypothetical protein
LTFDKQGHADYRKQVLNASHPDAEFFPDFNKGQTYSDSILALNAHDAVDLTEQHGLQAEYLK